jgi:radical SAM superfamily enzyme YgiQ (UPF0313 family)
LLKTIKNNALKFKLIYPKWKKLEGQTVFNLPPHGPVVMAAALPDYVSVEFVDENVQTLSYDDDADLIGISMMLTVQVKRGWEIATEYHKRGKKVIFGGISTMLHAEETMQYADSVFLGEVEGRLEEVMNDFLQNKLKKVYDYLSNPCDIRLVNTARRDILTRNLYNHKGVQMVDLFHASRGCRFNCYPCASSYLGGKNFRPRPIEKSIEELEKIDNNRLFIVDNSLAQDTKWELELFKEMIPLKKKWCCHPIEDNLKVLDMAAQAGAWYVYQAIFDTSDFIKERIKRYHDHGIGVEGTILLGLDEHDEDYIKRLIDFLLEIDLDLAEFTVMTPFPHTRPFDDYQKENRIFNYDWNDYSADKVVFHPKKIKAERLQELFFYAWDTFYKNESQNKKMLKLFQKVVVKEQADGSFKPRQDELVNNSFGKKATWN